MKGITHFAAGVATASFFPFAVVAAAEHNPLYFLLAGICALLPDTLDFKFLRFLVRHDMEVIPDPSDPDPQMIANAVAHAVNSAYRAGKPVRIKLNTVKLGPDRWQRYTVKFNVAKRRVEVAIGPVVGMSGMPSAGEEHAGGKTASAGLVCPIVLDYEAATVVDMLDGPFFTMHPLPGGRVRPEFLSWHRQWTHGLPAGLVLSLAAAVAWGIPAGLVAFTAWCSHIATDQIGFMGSAVFFPFRRDRLPGLKLAHSGSAVPNAVIVWLCCVLVFWNLYRASAAPLPPLNLAQLLLFASALPAGVIVLVDHLLRPHAPPDQY